MLSGHSVQVRAIAATLLAVALAHSGVTHSAGQPQPASLRYGLVVGDWLIYERQVSARPADEGGPVRRSTDQIQVWCFAERGDQRTLLVDWIRNVGGEPEPIIGAVFHVDDRGRREIPQDALERVLALDAALDVLPPLRSALDAGPAWRSAPDLYGRVWRVTPSPAPATAGQMQFDFVIEDPTGVSDALRTATSGAFTFDTRAGVVTRVESRTTRVASIEHVTITLRHRVTNEARWCAQRAGEAGRYLRTLGQEAGRIATFHAPPGDGRAVLERLDRLWEAFELEADAREKSPLRPIAAARRAALQRDAGALAARLRAAQNWIDRKPPAWTLHTETGAELVSESLRGRVLIECFWSTETEWAVRALPVLRDLQVDLGDRAAIICINLDADLAAGQRALSFAGEGLRHVLGGSLREVEGVPETPVFRLRDADGVVRAVAFGWRPTLREWAGRHLTPGR